MAIGDLRRAVKHTTLMDLAETQDEDKWTHTWRNFSHILTSILKGLVHINGHGYQHYDLKGSIENTIAKTTKTIVNSTCTSLLVYLLIVY